VLHHFLLLIERFKGLFQRPASTTVLQNIGLTEVPYSTVLWR